MPSVGECINVVPGLEIYWVEVRVVEQSDVLGDMRKTKTW